MFTSALTSANPVNSWLPSWTSNTYLSLTAMVALCTSNRVFIGRKEYEKKWFACAVLNFVEELQF